MLNELLEDDDILDFIVMDGNGCLYATLQGNTRTILLKFTVDLTYPSKKHGRGGQPAVFVSAVLLTITVMLKLALPHVSILSKVFPFKTILFVNTGQQISSLHTIHTYIHTYIHYSLSLCVCRCERVAAVRFLRGAWPGLLHGGGLRGLRPHGTAAGHMWRVG